MYFLFFIYLTIIEHALTVASKNREHNIKNAVTLNVRFVKPLNLSTKDIFVYLVISKNMSLKKLLIKETCKIFYFLLKITRAKLRDKMI